MERETRKFNAGIHVVEIKNFLTERENRETIKTLSNSVKLGIGGVETQQADTTTLLAYQDKLVEQWIVSVDGKTENFIEGMLDWDKKDYRMVIDMITEMGKEDEKKTK